jgi:hypothetical protein
MRGCSRCLCAANCTARADVPSRSLRQTIPGTALLSRRKRSDNLHSSGRSHSLPYPQPTRTRGTGAQLQSLREVARPSSVVFPCNTNSEAWRCDASCNAASARSPRHSIPGLTRQRLHRVHGPTQLAREVRRAIALRHLRKRFVVPERSVSSPVEPVEQCVTHRAEIRDLERERSPQ